MKPKQESMFIKVRPDSSSRTPYLYDTPPDLDQKITTYISNRYSHERLATNDNLVISLYYSGVRIWRNR